MSDLPLPVRGRLLGIDHGTKVIGLALCDGLWLSARPYGLIKRKSREADFAEISTIILKQQIRGVVVGVPEVEENFSGVSQANTVRRWASRLAAAISIPVYEWNEQFSTLEAKELAHDLGQRGRIDDLAATIILQSFIDAHPPQMALPKPIKNTPSDTAK